MEPGDKRKRGKYDMKYVWKRLNKQQVGAYSEYFVKMEMTMYGLQVYTTEVDDRGVDFVARYEKGRFLSIQVKSLRDKGYVFMEKDKFEISRDSYLALVILKEGIEPKLFLIPSEAWKHPNELLADHNYAGKKSKPEWGVNVSYKNMKQLEMFSFEKMINSLKEG